MKVKRKRGWNAIGILIPKRCLCFRRENCPIGFTTTEHPTPVHFGADRRSIQFVGRGGGSLERQKQDSHIYRKTGISPLIFWEKRNWELVIVLVPDKPVR